MTKGNISWASLLTAVDTPALNCPFLLLVIKVLFKKLMRAGANPKKVSTALRNIGCKLQDHQYSARRVNVRIDLLQFTSALK